MDLKSPKVGHLANDEYGPVTALELVEITDL